MAQAQPITSSPARPTYRALDVMDRIPANHAGVIVTDNSFAPHLQFSEVAVVDTQDKSIQFGELYVITLSEGTPRMSLAIVQLLRETVGLWYGFSLDGNGGLMFEGKRHRYVDGPLRTEYWPEKCVGRIVGVVAPKWDLRTSCR